MSDTVSAVSSRNLWKIFKQGRRVVKALQDITLDVVAGEFLALRGSSGSGKSTLLNIIGGLDIPTTGQINTLSVALGGLNQAERGTFRRRNIGFVFQELTLVPHLTALENVALPLAFETGGAKHARAAALKLLDQFDLGDRADHLPSELSYGERQRVAISRAAIRAPSILLADEPTANLDDANVDRVWRIFLDLRDKGTTIISATHDPRLEAHADRVVRIEGGQLQS
jgi:ABC-type lipoprotein export system ATPase subunit